MRSDQFDSFPGPKGERNQTRIITHIGKRTHTHTHTTQGTMYRELWQPTDSIGGEKLFFLSLYTNFSFNSSHTRTAANLINNER